MKNKHINKLNFRIMYKYLLILNGKTIKGYKSFKSAINGYERYLLEITQDQDYLTLLSMNEGVIRESFL